MSQRQCHSHWQNPIFTLRIIGDLTLVKVCLLLRLKYYAFGNYLKIETIENIPVTYMGKPIMDHISDTKYPPLTTVPSSTYFDLAVLKMTEAEDD